MKDYLIIRRAALEVALDELRNGDIQSAFNRIDTNLKACPSCDRVVAEAGEELLKACKEGEALLARMEGDGEKEGHMTTPEYILDTPEGLRVEVDLVESGRVDDDVVQDWIIYISLPSGYHLDDIYSHPSKFSSRKMAVEIESHLREDQCK